MNEGAGGSRAPTSPPLIAGTTHTKSNWRRARSDLRSDDEHSENFGPHKALKVPRIKGIEEIIQRRIEEASHQLRNEVEPCGLRTSDSPLSKEITSHCFPKKFMISSFEYFFGAIDSIRISDITRTRCRSIITMTSS